MSLTRDLVSELKRKLRADAPLSDVSAPPPITPSPVKPFPKRALLSTNPHTPALLGIGHAGTRYCTPVVLQFQAELAVAHEAVATELPDGWFEKNSLLSLRSQAGSHREFLLRPDLGRRLDAESCQRLREQALHDRDVQIILADGLSAVACMQSGLELLSQVVAQCEALGLSVGTSVGAKFARVWLEDEIGEITQAKVSIMLLGERPGLGTGDGLSAYLVYQPSIGKTDGDRNMMSNIHARGTPPAQAARRLALLAKAMIEQRVSGVALHLATLSDLGDATSGYRPAQVRENLVEVL